MRWSGRSSWVTITPVPPGTRTVTLWMSDGGRPPAVEPARVTVYLDEQPLGTVTVTTGFHPYEFQVPPPLAASAAAADSARLRLVSNPWTPRDVLGNGDARDLGVMVDRVQVR